MVSRDYHEKCADKLMLNIMYHFVGCDESLKSISQSQFIKQLDSLQSKYTGGEFCVTFDHGTIDHIENVTPELEHRQLVGLFFVLTMVPEENKVPFVDKQRYLESVHRMDLAKMLCQELNIDYRPECADSYLDEFKFYSLEERYLRYLRDKKLEEKTYCSFVDKQFEKKFGNEADFAKKNYLNWAQIKELRNRGHIVGSHSHYHVGDRDDYTKSIYLIEKYLNEKVEYITYPDGVKRISDDELIKLGITKAFLSRENGSDNFRTGRADCMQLDLSEYNQKV